MILIAAMRIIPARLCARVVPTGNSGRCAGGAVRPSKKIRILHMYRHISLHTTTLHAIDRALLFGIHTALTGDGIV